ncbi:TetR/AcrR family transcriptional regulator [Aeromicrobium sp.]|uniref:TetR/AcrR family transcriptional regulator n=1 Tax=Aeromicrobium sp. TaxID=1871063 RepID=UPI0030BFE38C
MHDEVDGPARDDTVRAGVRERILDTAAELFYQEGVRAVGVDLIVDRSRVAKTSLYRHFETKDLLVVAVLERDDVTYWQRWDEIARQGHDDARSELEAHFRWIADYIAQPMYRGCPFLNVATEFPSDGHPARAVAVRHKTELRRRLGALVAEVGGGDPNALADQLVLLIDGAYANGQLLGGQGSAPSLVPAALALLSMAIDPQGNA